MKVTQRLLHGLVGMALAATVPGNTGRALAVPPAAPAHGAKPAAKPAPLAPPPVTLYVNRRRLQSPALNVRGTMMVPLGGLLQTLGLPARYDAQRRIISTQFGKRRIQLQIGSATGYIAGQPYRLPLPAQNLNHRLMVPLRFVAQAVGARIQYDPAHRLIRLSVTLRRAAPTTAQVPPAVWPPARQPPQTAIRTFNALLLQVDAEPPPVVAVSVQGQTSTYPVGDNATVLRTFVSADKSGTQTQSPLYPVPLNSLLPGEQVQMQLNEQDQVVRLVAHTLVREAQVRAREGTVLALGDAWNTRLNMDENLPVVDAAGVRQPVSVLRPQVPLVLFINPHTHNIYRVVLGTLNDLLKTMSTAAAVPEEVTPTPETPATGSPPGQVARAAPRIQLVTHDAPRPLRAGQTVNVVVRATPGTPLVYDISPRQRNLPLRQTVEQPGVYRGAFTTRAGQDVLAGHLLAHTVGRGPQDSLQCNEALTVDSVPPRIGATLPAEGSTILSGQPNISLYCDDTGGSGLARASLTLSNNGRDYPLVTTVAPPFMVTAVAPRALAGLMKVQARVEDAAGNAAFSSFSFIVAAPKQTLVAVCHDAVRPLVTGEAFAVDLWAVPGGHAWFDVTKQSGEVLAQHLPMVQIEPGRYRGFYTVQNGIQVERLRLVGNFRNAEDQVETMEASTLVELVAGARQPAQPLVTQPAQGPLAGPAVVVRGRATPETLVEVGLAVLGTNSQSDFRYDPGVVQVRVDSSGVWETPPLALPRPRIKDALRAEISATVIDDCNRRSATTVVVFPVRGP